eukprot:CAMPEP_0179428868 /NCGR_PEP_ID=MMETSP0799-20121207/14418_1 /TAXON_ID=46947 /ORGANISM="Geminigera cryophila, Strain CCMP2564" /LENGTH=310 /DNA_ID=CAMNT_0021204549 /DNA_START=95 /DNA_END=1027 /DNA_ORIENTATION=+
MAPPRILKVAQSPRVLSIQSHTVHGYVGNKSAVFPMQTLGLEVDFVNSVQFSNHTGYQSFTGSSLDGEELSKLIQGLESNELLTHSHLLTGYMRSATLAHSVAQTLGKLRKRNPDVIYVCDPVMGDNGQLYVPEEMVTCYREQIAPLASVLTPNQFEAELLSGINIIDLPSALKAVDWLHDLGIPCVVITSISFPSEPDTITLLASLVHSANGGEGGARKERVKMNVKKLPQSFTGTGDLIAALLLAWFQRGADLKTVVEYATATVQAVLSKTLQASDGSVRSRELQLIASRDQIANPQVPDSLRAERLP